MKKQFVTAALSLIALSGLTHGAFAEDKVTTQDWNGKKVVVVADGANDYDRARATWAFYNADAREIKRFEALGLSEADFKAIANIAYYTGLSTDYIARQALDTGTPLGIIATEHGLPTTIVTNDLPGFGNVAMGIENKQNTNTYASLASANMMNDPVMTASLTESTTVASSSTAPATTSTTASSALAGDVMAVASADPQFSTFISAVKAAGLADTLRGMGPYTIFAPTNDAFAKLPAGTLESWLKPENKDQLVALLNYHIVPGKLKAADVMAMTNPSNATTLGGKTVSVKTTSPLMFGNANIVRSDIEASNGVIHAIDTVLTPDTTATPAPAPATPAPVTQAPAPTTPPAPVPAPPAP